jgi:hypothetical protein
MAKARLAHPSRYFGVFYAALKKKHLFRFVSTRFNAFRVLSICSNSASACSGAPQDTILRNKNIYLTKKVLGNAPRVACAFPIV